MGLCKGNLRILDRHSPNSLYDTSIGSFVMSPDYNQKDAEGFINILGLPLRLAAAKRARSAGVSPAVAGASRSRVHVAPAFRPASADLKVGATPVAQDSKRARRRAA
jgi:hypothetical protein